MRMKIKKWLAAFTVAAGMVLPATTAFAFTDEAAQQAVEAPAPTETPVQEEEPPKTEETPFSVPGNGSLADDKSGDSTKEFLTVQTKNGNTFFLVLDRSSNKENVYMLSMIDEDDLAEFVTETKKQNSQQSLHHSRRQNLQLRKRKRSRKKKVKRLIPGRCLPLRCLP